jgi:hypothetical protein
VGTSLLFHFWSILVQILRRQLPILSLLKGQNKTDFGVWFMVWWGHLTKSWLFSIIKINAGWLYLLCSHKGIEFDHVPSQPGCIKIPLPCIPMAKQKCCVMNVRYKFFHESHNSVSYEDCHFEHNPFFRYLLHLFHLIIWYNDRHCTDRGSH